MMGQDNSADFRSTYGLDFGALLARSSTMRMNRCDRQGPRAARACARRHKVFT